MGILRTTQRGRSKITLITYSDNHQKVPHPSPSQAWDSNVFRNIILPSNFSLALILSESGNTVSDTVDTTPQSLKSNNGRGGINGGSIWRLTKQKIFIPTPSHELEHHLNHGIHIIAVICTSKSYLVYQINSVLIYVKRNQAAYCDLQKNDKLFVARILYVVDVRIQNFLYEAHQGNFDLDPLDFSRMFEEIIHNRTFKAHLPSCIHYSKNKRETDDNSSNKGMKGETVRNRDMNPKWQIRPDEKYVQVYHPSTSYTPRHNDIPICYKFQVIGACNNSCSYGHNKVARNTPLHSTRHSLP